MKSIAIDFKNNQLCIMKKGQQGTERCNLKKEDFYEFIPENIEISFPLLGTLKMKRLLSIRITNWKQDAL